MNDESARAFAVPLSVARVLSSFNRPWFVAGGWALDLFLGRVTRPHDDLEIAILRSEQLALRGHLKGYAFCKVEPASHEMTAWHEDEWLSAPIHEIHAFSEESEPRRLESLLEESDDKDWHFGRNRAIARPLSMLGIAAGIGIPILRPEIVLLYKARDRRPEDLSDFSEVRPAMDAAAVRWLAEALALCYPRHPWLRLL